MSDGPARGSSSLRGHAMKDKHWLWIIPTSVLALAAAIWFRVRTDQSSSPGSSIPVRVLFVTGGPGDYWDDTVRGARAAADKLKVDLDVQAPADHENPSQQSEILAKANFKK